MKGRVAESRCEDVHSRVRYAFAQTMAITSSCRMARVRSAGSVLIGVAEAHDLVRKSTKAYSVFSCSRETKRRFVSSEVGAILCCSVENRHISQPDLQVRFRMAFQWGFIRATLLVVQRCHFLMIEHTSRL